MTLSRLTAALALSVAVGLGACATSIPASQVRAPQPTKPIDLERFYFGQWLEVARLPMRITDGCVAATTDYVIVSPTRVDLRDACRQGGIDGRERAVGAAGVILDPGFNAKLRAPYFGGLLTWEYWVLDRADDYSWFISADPKFVALVDGRPQLPGHRFPSQTDRVAQAGGEDPRRARSGIDLQNRRAVDLLFQTVLGDVGVGANADIEAGSVSRGDQRLGPVVVSSGRQVGDLDGCRLDPGLPGPIREGHHGIGIGHEQTISDQRHAEGRHEVLKEDRPGLRYPVAVRITQQGDAVGARHPRARAAHDQPLDPTADPTLLVFRLWRRVGFGDQHIAVREAIQPARVIQP